MTQQNQGNSPAAMAVVDIALAKAAASATTVAAGQSQDVGARLGIEFFPWSNIKTFHEDNGQDLLAAGEIDVVMEYNGDIAQVMKEDDDLNFVVPKEGAMRQSDTLAIPKGAPHPENALKFINFILDAKTGEEITKTILYPSPNAAAVALMPTSYKDNPVIFPPADLMAKCEYPRYLGPEFTRLLDEAMTRLRAA